MDIPDTRHAYNEAKMAEMFHPVTGRLAGVTWHGPFWPQGLLIVQIHEDWNSDKPIRHWQVCVHSYAMSVSEETDGYMGGWVVAADFRVEPTKEQIARVLLFCQTF